MAGHPASQTEIAGSPGYAPVALITGIGGQDGYYLARLLLSQGYAVHGILRRRSTPDQERANDGLAALPGGERLVLHAGDLLDPIGLRRIISRTQPTEVYNLAGQSHVQASFEDPIYTANVVAMGTLNLLEAIRDYRDSMGRPVRFYQASSSEIFGQTANAPQNEQTPLCPRSPYACAKAHAYWQTITCRDAYGLYACNGILYNHESPRRAPGYVTRKITLAAARIKCALQHTLTLGNVDARRDWGFAGDYVHAMWLMLQQPQPADYVVATGETHSVRELLEIAFGCLRLDWRDHVRVDERFYRPTEPRLLVGDASKARRVLGWSPSVSFERLIEMMVRADLARARRERQVAQVEGEVADSDTEVDCIPR